MDYARLGSSGLEVSRLCLGTMSFGTAEGKPWLLPLAAARPLYRRAWEQGINFFDTANMYAEGTSEEVTGELLREMASRDEVVIATKVYRATRAGANSQGLSRKAIMAEIDHSLRRLRTDYVDLYQIHRADPNTSPEETMEALHDLIKAGKVRYIGASSMYCWQFLRYQHAAERNGWTRFVSMQNQLSLVYREEEREMLPACRADGVGVIPWSPLGAGKLARPWRAASERAGIDPWRKSMYDQETDQPIVAAVERIAGTCGVPMAQVALAWVLQVPAVTAPVIGVSRAEHIDTAVAALSLKLPDDTVSELERHYRTRPVARFS